MQTREAGRKRLRRRMIVSSAAIVVSMLLCLMIASNLIRDIGSYQHDQYTTTACKMLKTHAEQIRSESKELLDQMTLDVNLGKLMNYAECDAGSLMMGLRKLQAYQKTCPWVDSIYLYNAQNDTFYVVSDYALQAVQAKEEFFDGGVSEIVDGIHDYRNMEPLVRCFSAGWPQERNIGYVTFLRYNTLAKGRTNVYLINIKQDVFFQYADVWQTTPDDCLMYLNADGEILMTKTQTAEITTLAGAVNNAQGQRGRLSPSASTVAVYDRSFPFGWTFVYQCTAYDQFSAMSAVEHGLVKVFLLMALLAALLVLVIIFVRRFFCAMHERIQEQQEIQQEQQHVRRMAEHYHILNALNGKETLENAAPGVARILMVCDGGETERPAASLISLLQQKRGITCVFREPDEKGREVLCLRDADGEESALIRSIREAIDESGKAGRIFAVLSDEFEYPQGLSEAYQQCLDMEAYQPLCMDESLFTREDLNRRQNYVWNPDEALGSLKESMLALQTETACNRIHMLVRQISEGTLQTCREGILRLLVSVTETVAQINRQYGVSASEREEEGLRDLSPKHVENYLCAWIRRTIDDVQEKRSSKYGELTEKICKFIQENACRADFCAATVAEAFELSAPYISKIIKGQTGKSISEYIVDTRLRAAKTMLASSSLPISQIAENVGFSDAQYFHRVFKNAEQLTPGQYRKEHQSNEKGETTDE